jgi:hypothetical protein
MSIEADLSKTVTAFRSLPGIAQTGVPHTWPDFIHLLHSSFAALIQDSSAKNVQSFVDTLLDITKTKDVSDDGKALLMNLTCLRQYNLILRSIDGMTSVIATMIDTCLSHKSEIEHFYKEMSSSRNRKTSYHG